MMKLKQLRCSFCGKNETEVLKLVAGSRVYICNECVALASQIMEDDSHPDSPPSKAETSVWRRLLVRGRKWWRGGMAQRINAPGVSG